MLGEIVSIEKIECSDEFVYNLEVEAETELNKNYFADGLLVSNCHSMSGHSSESLLKLLEEPPARVRFILLTTEVKSIRGTIISRCQLHEFKKIYWREISNQLEMISKSEKIDIELEALHLCAKLSDGSMRNGVQNLEKLLNFAGAEQKINIEHAQKVFGTVSDLLFYDLVYEICKDGVPDATKGYSVINDLLVSGIGVSQVFDGISEVLRNVLIGVSAKSAGNLIMISDEAKNRLKEQLRLFKPKMRAIVGILRGLTDARMSVEYGQSLDIALQMWFLDSILVFKGD